MKATRLPVFAATLVMLAGCTTKTGDANPASTTEASNGASSTTRSLPQRPRELDLTGIDPCTDVLTRDQMRQLAYDLGYERAPLPDKSNIHGGPNCLYSSSRPSDQPSRDVAALVGISTSEGAEAWLTDPNRDSNANLAHQTKVDGFPALVIPHPDVADNCLVVVDVHEGQYLEVSGNPSGGAHGTSPDPYCAEAERVAGMVIETLSAGR